MNSVFVKIPKTGQSNLTLFAEGILLDQTDKGRYYELELSTKYCMILFYKFQLKHRSLYIVCSPELMNNKFTNYFALVSDKMSIVAQLKGRGYDQFKRSLEYLKKATDNKVMQLSPAFWWQLAYLCSENKNCKINLDRLLMDYNLEVKEVKWK